MKQKQMNHPTPFGLPVRLVNGVSQSLKFLGLSETPKTREQWYAVLENPIIWKVPNIGFVTIRDGLKTLDKQTGRA